MSDPWTAVDRAHRTLERGSRFLGTGLARADQAGPQPIAGRYRAKVVGNGLRELDRFLNVLIGALADAQGRPLPDAQHNTANKLSAFCATLGLDNHDRLRALGRSRDCLFHCAGIVRRTDAPGAAAMTVGWWDEGGERPMLRSLELGEELVVTAAQLEEVCLYYAALGQQILASAGIMAEMSHPLP